MGNIDLNRPVSEYGRSTQYFKQHGAYLHEDLEQNQLRVELRPAPEKRFIGHQVRRVVSENPVWYQNFFAEQQWVRRDRTLNSLERIVLGEDRRSDAFPFATYDGKTRRLIHDHLRDGYESSGGVVPPCNDYRETIGLSQHPNGYALLGDGAENDSSRGQRAIINDGVETVTVDAPF